VLKEGARAPRCSLLLIKIAFARPRVSGKIAIFLKEAARIALPTVINFFTTEMRAVYEGMNYEQANRSRSTREAAVFAGVGARSSDIFLEITSVSFVFSPLHFALPCTQLSRKRETLTASLVARDEIALFVEVMRGIQSRVFRMDMMKVLAIEDDTAQSPASG